MKNLVFQISIIALAVTVMYIPSALFKGNPVSASHHTFLPGLPSPLISHVLEGNSITYCLDQRAEGYPNFPAQVVEVFDSFEEKFGMEFTKVPWSTNGDSCNYQLSMYNFFVADGSRVAAHVYYLNWPVLAEFRPILGYVRWHSGISHETGHAVLGLHEQYIDFGNPLACDNGETGMQSRLGYATIMSCGTFIWVPTARDVEVTCSMFDFMKCPKEEAGGEPTKEPIEEITKEPIKEPTVERDKEVKDDNLEGFKSEPLEANGNDDSVKGVWKGVILLIFMSLITAVFIMRRK